MHPQGVIFALLSRSGYLDGEIRAAIRGGIHRCPTRQPERWRRSDMKPCRECQKEISEQAVVCPQCGAPYPANEKWDGYGFEYKSKATFLGLPWLHISFKYSPSKRPVPAKGVFAVGQFACGIFTLSQFGVGVVSIGQFVVAGYALAQFAAAYSLIAQMGIYVYEGHGQLVRSLAQLLGMGS